MHGAGSSYSSFQLTSTSKVLGVACRSDFSLSQLEHLGTGGAHQTTDFWVHSSSRIAVDQSLRTSLHGGFRRISFWVPRLLQNAWLLNRLVTKHRMISIGKTCFSLKINISIHNWASKKICSIRYTQYVHISFWTLRKWLYLRPQHSKSSPKPKAADFFGCCLSFV